MPHIYLPEPAILCGPCHGGRGYLLPSSLGWQPVWTLAEAVSGMAASSAQAGLFLEGPTRLGARFRGSRDWVLWGHPCSPGRQASPGLTGPMGAGAFLSPSLCYCVGAQDLTTMPPVRPSPWCWEADPLTCTRSRRMNRELPQEIDAPHQCWGS